MNSKTSDYYRQKVRNISSFDYTLDYKNLNLRDHPELYSIWRWEQWVLMVEPYKSEILPHRRFKTPEIAEQSSKKIYAMFLEYIKDDDFVWADMARKFLQMGRTRSRRYANHASWKKYKENPQHANSKAEETRRKSNQYTQKSDALTNKKAQSAKIFYKKYVQAREHPRYHQLKEKFLVQKWSIVQKGNSE